MNGSYLLDSNIVIALLCGEEPVKDRVAKAEEVFISSTVLGELYFGARNSGRVEQNLAQIDEIAESIPVLGCNEDTATVYGLVKAELKKKGSLIPDNDIWIAASARQFDLILSSRDKHFDSVPGISLEKW